MDMNNSGATLRDTISAAVEEVEKRDAGPSTETPAPVEKEAPVEAKTEDTAAGRTAGRKRDEAGRLLPGKAERSEPAQKAPEAAITAPAAPAKPRPSYPSTWKKDYASKWDTVDPDLAEEIHRRESDFARGVSTYKAEYDRVKPLDEAIKPYLQTWEQAGVAPDSAIRSLAETDRILRNGSKEDKLRLVAHIAQSYGIPIHEMLVRGEDGSVYFNQQYMSQPQQQSQGITPQDVQRLVDQKVAQVQLQTAVQQFTAAKDASGNPLYPHFGKVEVRKTMDGLLRAGLAQDLPSAYAKALRMPEHAELIQAEENSRREAEKAAEARARADAAARAKNATVSVKSSSPTGAITNTSAGGKGLRDHIAAAFDAVESGRV